MKIKNLFYVSLAALSLAACSKDDAPVPDGGVTFKLTSTPSATKAVTASVGAEGIIKSATVYLFHKSDNAKSRSTVVTPDDETGNVIVNVPAGDYTVAAVANYTPAAAGTMVGLKEGSVALTATTKNNFVMFGTGSDVSVAAGESKVGGDIMVYRLVAALQLGTITFEIPETADKFYVDAQAAGNIVIKSIGLEKSISSIKLGGDADGTTTVTENPLLSGTIGTKPVTTVSGKKTIVVTSEDVAGSIGERVYGYPGTKAILDVTVTYGTGDSARDRHYSIDLSNNDKLKDGFVANYLYTISATINGIGSGEGGSDNKDAITTWTVKSQDWATGVDISGGSVGN